MKNQLIYFLASLTRILPKVGLERFLRVIYHPDKRSHDYLETVAKIDGNYFNINTANFIEWRMFFFGSYERGISNIIKRNCGPGSTVMDIGANIGAHTLTMARLAKKVIAVEPHPLLVKRLKSNVELNEFTNVEVVECALSDKNGTAILNGFHEGMANKSGSLYPCNSELTDKIPVRLKTLDEVARGLTRLDFIKIDSDGSDGAILFGGKETLKKFHPTIIFEYFKPSWEMSGYDLKMVKNLLEETGYNLHSLDESGNFYPLNEKGDNVIAIANNN